MSEEHPSEDRQVERDSQLSAMFDGELTAAECELLARRLTRDEALRAQWSRFALIGAALRAERGVALNDRVAWRVQSTIAQDPSYGDSAAADLAAANSARSVTGSAAASPNSSSERWMRFVRPVAGAGIAAGVAAASIFWLQTQETDPVLTADATPTQTIVLQPEAASPGYASRDSARARAGVEWRTGALHHSGAQHADQHRAPGAFRELRGCAQRSFGPARATHGVARHRGCRFSRRRGRSREQRRQAARRK